MEGSDTRVSHSGLHLCLWTSSKHRTIDWMNDPMYIQPSASQRWTHKFSIPCKKKNCSPAALRTIVMRAIQSTKPEIPEKLLFKVIKHQKMPGRAPTVNMQVHSACQECFALCTT